MTKENYEQYLIRSLEIAIGNLAHACRNLSSDLQCMATAIDKKGIETLTDSTGLVQNQGLKIDLLCMKIHMLQRQLALYKAEKMQNDKTK